MGIPKPRKGATVRKYVPPELKETPNHICDHLILLLECWQVRPPRPHSCARCLPLRSRRAQAKCKIDRRGLLKAIRISNSIMILRLTDILPAKLLFHNCIWHVPPDNAFGELRGLLRRVQNIFVRGRCRVLEPEHARNFSVSPERVRDAANQGKGRRTRTRLSLSDDLLDESPIFRAILATAGSLARATSRNKFRQVVGE
ncbi:hypothetical protein BC827DRAFT_592421 [Russula dissimulans]|nr:hypothetical protein BC827DRAFT_592421 [Russula dissimulans]